ncbi:pyruvate dehydrogenase [acetyl-transferring]-phosphatase 1, mitochondrial-like [Diaphorina citri]|uniref:Pyruvate dehydrogenase [acetyl-transferring]-phosphatase 1, mitochondrial-like n=2 Tax=Diaphorina citri TaxID=121845 RepID=A0A1S4EN31_DIACI|nr:pyruvate dehydrogenase [acetyl-transferring]-phosphatase 1, mitochondrial-like [Diaphorina citri]
MFIENVYKLSVLNRVPFVCFPLNLFKSSKICLKWNVSTNVVCYHSISTSSQALRQTKLTPQEVTTILRTNEFSLEIENHTSVKSYDSNQLPSNKPIEDTRCEAKCLLTTGVLLGVFDGHGGAACAQVLSKRLFDYIAATLLPDQLISDCLARLESQEPIQLVESYNDKFDIVGELKQLYLNSFKSFLKQLLSSQKEQQFEMKHMLVNAFLSLDQHISQEAQLKQGGNHLNMKTLGVGLSGNYTFFSACGNQTQNFVLTRQIVEHNTDNVREVERILNEHPKNERDTVIRMERLLGQLAPLRAFGDVRYKWSKELLQKYVVPHVGEQALAPNYFTPPYLTAQPDVIHYRLTPRDRFLILATDGLWDLLSPLQAVRLVGEHMSGKVTLRPLQLPRKHMKLSEINELLIARQEGLSLKPLDSNAATHLLRHALGGTEYGIEHSKIAQLLSMPQEVVRLFRDDITITVVYFDSDYLRSPNVR